MSSEIEAKYRIDNPDYLEHIRALSQAGAYRLVAAPQAEQQENCYYDTADRLLARRAYGLRIRRVAGQAAKATLKGPARQVGGVFERGEWEVAATDPHPHTWPVGAPRMQAEALLGGAPLLPLLAITTTRQHVYATLAAEPPDAAPVAEISLDTSTIAAAGLTEHMHELEIELLPGGTRADVHALAAALGQHIPLHPETHSKLERGLALLKQAEPS